MPIVNLKQQYPHLYEETMLEISDPIFEVYELSRKKENAYNRRKYRYRAHYSLDAGDFIELHALQRVASPEEIWMDRLQKEQLREALNHLTPVQARRIYAYFMLRISIPKIAQSEGISVSAACHSIHGGLKNLKRYYQKHYHQERMDEIEAFK